MCNVTALHLTDEDLEIGRQALLEVRARAMTEGRLIRHGEVARRIGELTRGHEATMHWMRRALTAEAELRKMGNPVPTRGAT